jgi:hypothetical protein
LESKFLDTPAAHPYEIRVKDFKYFPFLKIRVTPEKLPLFEQLVARAVFVN